MVNHHRDTFNEYNWRRMKNSVQINPKVLNYFKVAQLVIANTKAFSNCSRIFFFFFANQFSKGYLKTNMEAFRAVGQYQHLPSFSAKESQREGHHLNHCPTCGSITYDISNFTGILTSWHPKRYYCHHAVKTGLQRLWLNGRSTFLRTNGQGKLWFFKNHKKQGWLRVRMKMVPLIPCIIFTLHATIPGLNNHVCMGIDFPLRCFLSWPYSLNRKWWKPFFFFN